MVLTSTQCQSLCHGTAISHQQKLIVTLVTITADGYRSESRDKLQGPPALTSGSPLIYNPALSLEANVKCSCGVRLNFARGDRGVQIALSYTFLESITKFY